MKILLDTNVLLETKRPVPNPFVLERLASTAAEDKFISVITIGEIAVGTARLGPGKRRRELEEWPEQAGRSFTDRLLPIDRDIAHLWGDLIARMARAGKVIHPRRRPHCRHCFASRHAVDDPQCRRLRSYGRFTDQSVGRCELTKSVAYRPVSSSLASG